MVVLRNLRLGETSHINDSAFDSEGKAMKHFVNVLMVWVILSGFVVVIGGCSQPGETTEEVNRRHIRNLRTNQMQMNEDIDKTFLLDKPTRLSDRRVP